MSRNSRLLPALLAIAIALPITAHAAALQTTTTLTLSSPSVAWHAPVKLTAQVTAGGAPVTEGTVTFCDLSGPYTRCEDSAIAGRAQITGAGAQINIIPAIGAHKYTAIFNGTNTAAASTSAAQALTVIGLYPTATSIAASGNPSGYQLTATVIGFANQPPTLSGTVSFQDTSNGNFVLGTASLGTPGPAVETFVPATGSPILTGNQPAAGASADFNGDGIPDLAIMASFSNAIYILLGNGDGTFRVANGSPINGVGNTPCSNQFQASNCSMAVGDFNHDGKADLAETSDFDNTVIVLLGNGDGTFAPASGSPINVGNFPEAVGIGDFNNDGVLDLVVANANDNTVSILLGNGDGTFTAVAPVPTGGFPFYLAVADFNHDGAADIAVSNEADSTVSVLLGNGDGTFAPAPGSPIPGFNYNPAQVVAADFNGDGYPDLAVADFIPLNQIPPVVNQTSNVVIMLGNGDGTFHPGPGSPITTGLYALALVAADFNQDGHTDLAVDNYGVNTAPPTQALQFLIGDVNNDGGFTQPLPTTQLGNSPNGLIAADFNGDGTTDLAIPNVGEFDTTILLNAFKQTATASISNIAFAGTGTHYVDAVYGGNTYFATSTSLTTPLQGLQVKTGLTLTANPPEQMLTMPVTFIAQLASLSNEPPFATPTGTVSFFDQSLGGQLLGTAPMGANGQAVFTTATIGPGVHVISASYTGDATFLPSNSNQVTEQIDDLLINRVGNNNTTILPGTTVLYTLQLAPAVATKFLYNVSFSASGLPAGASASFSPPTLAAGTTAAKITMTVTTANTSFNAPPSSPFGRLPLALGLLLPLFGSRAMRRRMQKLPPLLAVGLLAVLGLAAVTGLSGCSGAGLFAARKVPYSITVTATEGTLQRSTTVPLAIQ
jgi:Bacterial Ig-like domain (group 3)/FG-GAP-like repeat